MRINIYQEELTEDPVWVSKEAEGRTFYGCRFYLASAEELHHTLTDDDRSAVTFWHEDEEVLHRLFRCAADYMIISKKETSWALMTNAEVIFDALDDRGCFNGIDDRMRGEILKVIGKIIKERG